jgi:DNA-nicking Smr family endonuclease
MKRLDLHGLRHEEARRAVIRFIEDNWGCGEETRFITGHSALMKKVVMDVLEEYKLLSDDSLDSFIQNKAWVTTTLE